MGTRGEGGWEGGMGREEKGKWGREMEGQEERYDVYRQIKIYDYTQLRRLRIRYCLTRRHVRFRQTNCGDVDSMKTVDQLHNVIL